MPKRAPGQVRDAIIKFLRTRGEQGAPMKEIYAAVRKDLGEVAESSMRSYLNINAKTKFERIAHGRYRLRAKAK